MAKNVTMKTKKEVYVDEKTNTKTEYDAFYVDVMGVEIKVKPIDGTAKKLLVSYLQSK